MKEIIFNKKDKIELIEIELNNIKKIIELENKNFLIIDQEIDNYFYVVYQERYAMKFKKFICCKTIKSQVKQLDTVKSILTVIKLMEGVNYIKYSLQIFKALKTPLKDFIVKGKLENYSIYQKLNLDFIVKPTDYKNLPEEKFIMNITKNDFMNISDKIVNKFNPCEIRKNPNNYLDIMIKIFVDSIDKK